MVRFVILDKSLLRCWRPYACRWILADPYLVDVGRFLFGRRPLVGRFVDRVCGPLVGRVRGEGARLERPGEGDVEAWRGRWP